MESTKQEAERINNMFRAVALIAAAALVGGAVFYHYIEHLSWVDAFYFCTVTLATVGYGDITPKTEVGKLFTSFYILGGVGIIATFASLMLKNAALQRELKRQAKKSKEKKID